MANTAVTDFVPWYYYVRPEEGNFHIGIVDKNGDAISVSNLNIKIFFTGPIADKTSDADTFTLPKSSEIALAKGIAYEYLLTEGADRKDLLRDFEREIDRLIMKKVNKTGSPAMVRRIKILP